MRIDGEPSGLLDEKRVYLPGVVAYFPCPSCGVEIRHDFQHHYLNFPTMNDEEIVCRCCPECEEDIYCTIILEVKVLAVQDAEGLQKDLIHS